MPVPRPTPASRPVGKGESPPLVPASDVQLSPSDRARARVGRLVRGKWRLDALLGVGGTSAVYAATHRNRGRAAIKMLHPELSGEPSVRGWFLREGYAANGVPHAGVVRILDDDVAEDGSVFLVMELLAGATLAARIEEARGPLSMDEALRVADGILDVLSAAHAQGIQHRDVTPNNVWITPNGEVKLIDFGSAFVLEPSAPSGAATAGQPMGTPAFMAPELARGRLGEVDARSDVYAVGAVMWAMLTGRAPRRAGAIDGAPGPRPAWSTEELLAAMTEPLPAISSARPELPGAIRALVDRALAFDKEERWHSARAMREMLSLARDAVTPPETTPDLAAVLDDCARTVEVRGVYPGALAAAADSSLEITLEPTRITDCAPGPLPPYAPFDDEPASEMNPLFDAAPRLPSIPPEALRAVWSAPPPRPSRAGRVALAVFAVLAVAALAVVIVDREAFPIFARGRALVQQMR